MQTRRTIAGVALALLFFAFAVPVFTFAQSANPLVPCGTEANADGTVKNPCGFDDFVILVKNITDYLIILGTAVSALAFAYAGFLMMTAQGEMGKVEEAKAIFGKVVIGLLFMLTAWIIVHAIEAVFMKPESGIKSLLQ